MKMKSYRELQAYRTEIELELKDIEEKHSKAIKRYWELKDELSRLTPIINRAMMREDGKPVRK